VPVKDSTKQLRGQLKSVRSAISETRDERAELRTARDEAKEAFAGVDLTDPSNLESDEFKAAEQAVKALGEADDKIADLQVSEQTILAMLGQDAPEPAENGNGPGGSAAGVGGLRGQIQGLTEGDAYKQLRESGAFGSADRLGRAVLGQLADRDQAMAMIAGGGIRMESEAEEKQVIGSGEKVGATRADRRGFISPLLKPLSLLDLIPTGTTDSNVVEYVQVTTKPEAAAETAEGEPKPRATLGTKDEEAPVRTIAGYVKVKKQALEDVAALSSLIGTLLPYDVRRRLENQILSGTGENGTIKGLLKTTGIGAPAKVETDNPADAILRAITTIVLADGEANFVALNPVTWQNLLLMRSGTGGEANSTGLYLYGSPGALPAPTIWGLAMTRNRVIPKATPLVGDANGAQILVRSGLNVLISDSDGDDFTRNRATVLAEMRAAFAVWRPGSFAKATVE
jgi:HK97 family phage major capsid protein